MTNTNCKLRLKCKFLRCLLGFQGVKFTAGGVSGLCTFEWLCVFICAAVNRSHWNPAAFPKFINNNTTDEYWSRAFDAIIKTGSTFRLVAVKTLSEFEWGRTHNLLSTNNKFQWSNKWLYSVKLNPQNQSAERHLIREDCSHHITTKFPKAMLT